MRFRSQDEFSIYCKKLIENKGRSYYMEIPLEPMPQHWRINPGESELILPHNIYVMTDSSSAPYPRRWFLYRSLEEPVYGYDGSVLDPPRPKYWCYRIWPSGEISPDGVVTGSLHWLKAYCLLGEEPFCSLLNWINENPFEIK